MLKVNRLCSACASRCLNVCQIAHASKHVIQSGTNAHRASAPSSQKVDKKAWGWVGMGWQEGMVVLLITHKYDRSIKTQNRRARKQKSKLSFSEACTRVLAYEASAHSVTGAPAMTAGQRQLFIWLRSSIIEKPLCKDSSYNCCYNPNNNCVVVPKLMYSIAMFPGEIFHQFALVYSGLVIFNFQTELLGQTYTWLLVDWKSIINAHTGTGNLHKPSAQLFHQTHRNCVIICVHRCHIVISVGNFSHHTVTDHSTVAHGAQSQRRGGTFPFRNHPASQKSISTCWMNFATVVVQYLVQIFFRYRKQITVCQLYTSVVVVAKVYTVW
ncbi:hypothetical protein T4B_9615 [Trichinella pseudospiralis]|uniref:Uncharacterized protein n=1 Tax=Trichinella pseudospiralis TaxID=6337 RepID=A0A0V1IKH0_TRIPS|nr:hypothetical protein T4B_9615 [Trichinella pseudospiralis]KRZ29772.1 hypothetical protein T4C_500 [Trichinella pseudospiralis]